MQLSHCSRTDCTSLNVHHLEKYFKSNNVDNKVCHPRCAYQNYSRSVMEGIAVNNTTIFVIYNNVSTTCFGHFITDHHQVGYNVRETIYLL
jgi:hypothetical protein